MTARPAVVMEITPLESMHLADLVRQFRDLLHAGADQPEARRDAAVARLVPDAYADDAEAARQFRELTEADLLGRRDRDALIVLTTLGDPGVTESASDPLAVAQLALTAEDVEAWLRTLAALRLILASRLEIHSDTDGDRADPRFGVYEWLGYRLETLVQAADRLT